MSHGPVLALAARQERGICDSARLNPPVFLLAIFALQK